MTRIVFWNIQNFSRNKINDPSMAVVAGHGGVTQNAASNVRRATILQQLHPTLPGPGGGAVYPHIIVVVEVCTGATGPGQLATNSLGRQGAIYMVQQLRAVTANPQWRLVPPIQVGTGGRVETVAIFYDGANLLFTGPNVWSGVQSVRPGPVPGAYPAAIISEVNAGLPPRMTPLGTTEEHCAPRIQFTHLGAPYATAIGMREPYMASFLELPAVGGRPISVFAAHASPQPVFAAQLQIDMSNIDEIVGGLAPNEVRVICGDFNLNLLMPPPAYAPAGPYALLTAQGYVPLLTPPLPQPAPIPPRYWGYFLTHIKAASKAMLWSTAATQSLYPGYGYGGSTHAHNFYSIDNILVRQAVAPLAGNRPTVLNNVVGTPYVAPGGLNVPLGTMQVAHNMMNLPAPGGIPMVWPNDPAPLSTPGIPAAMRGWLNYGHIYSTSDHLPIYAEV